MPFKFQVYTIFCSKDNLIHTVTEIYAQQNWTGYFQKKEEYKRVAMSESKLKQPRSVTC